MSISVALIQILIIFGYMLVGFSAGKLNIINPEQRKFLSSLITSVTLPFTIIAATNVETRKEDLASLFLATLIMLVTYLIVSVASILIANARRLPQDEKAAITGLITYPNSAFIGLPLCTALMGSWGTLYGAGAIAAYNIVFFTIQTSLFTNEKFRFRSLITPVNLSTVAMVAMLALRLHLPGPVQTVSSNVGGMTTPLALIIVGVMLAESDLMAVIREKRAYVISAIRNLIIPAIVVLVLSVLPFDQNMELAVIIFIACPVANLVTVYAIKTDMEPELCARTTLLSTLLFAVTLPVIMALSNIMI